MKTVVGKPLNLDSAVLGRVSKNKFQLRSRKNDILVSSQLGGGLWGYLAVITGDQEKKRLPDKIPCIYGVSKDDLSTLNEGDIVRIGPDGAIKVVWEYDSPHNSLLITETCNCNCVMCPQPSKKDEEDLTAVNLKILSLLNPQKVNYIGITGGEPTLKEEGLLKVLKYCKEHFSNATIAVLSNGRRFRDRDFTRLIAEIDVPKLIFCISLYSSIDKEHDQIVCVEGSFRDTVLGLYNLALFGQKVEIRTVILKQNHRHLPVLADFIYRNFPFAIHVAFMGMECIGLAEKNISSVWIDPLEYSEELSQSVKHLHRRDVNVSIYNLPLCLIPRNMWRFSKKSISTWKNIFLEQCKECTMLNRCCGVFSTSKKHSSNIIPMKY